MKIGLTRQKRQVHRGWKKSLLCLALVGAFLVTSFSYEKPEKVVASSLAELRQQKAENDKKVKEIEAEKKKLEKNLGNMKSEMYNLSESISKLEADIEQKLYEIEEARLLLEETQAKADEQYAYMKLRIQYMYENGSGWSWASLFESESFADMLVRAEYMMSIGEADKKLMDEYMDTLQQIEDYKAELEEENRQLEETKAELEDQKAKLLTSISNTKNNISSTTGKLNEAQQLSADLQKKIAEMEEYERRMRNQQALAASQLSADRLAKIAQQEAELANTRYVVTPGEGEAELLAALIYCEAGGETAAGKDAVATVVLNRVCSSYFPNSITGVIYANKQFSPVSSGRLAIVLENGLTTQACRDSANRVLAGGYTGNWLYFCVNNGNIPGTVIDHQVFY